MDKVSTRFLYLLISLICFQYILSSLLYITCTIVHKTCRNGKSKDRCALFTHKRCTVLVSRLCPFCPLYDKSQLYIFCSIRGVYFIHLIKVLIVVYKKLNFISFVFPCCISHLFTPSNKSILNLK